MFPYGVKLRLLAYSRNFLANQKARNAIVGAENLQSTCRYIHSYQQQQQQQQHLLFKHGMF